MSGIDFRTETLSTCRRQKGPIISDSSLKWGERRGKLVYYQRKHLHRDLVAPIAQRRTVIKYSAINYKAADSPLSTRRRVDIIRRNGPS